MKKILLSLLLLLCATAGMALPDKDEQGYFQVSNLQELKDAVNATKDGNGKSTSKIKLIDNIYLNGMDGTLCTTFAGEIDGSYPTKDKKGNAIIGCRMILGYGAEEKVNKDKPRKTCYYLFSYMDGAKIKNVGFHAIRIQSSDRDNMGVIASQAKSTTFETVLVDSCSIYTNKDKAGAVVGLATNCTFNAVVVRQCDVTVDGVKAGGLVGDSENNTFTNCGVSAGSAVFADGNNATNHGWSGGFAGYSKNDKFAQCINGAFVGADQQHVGGFAGESVESEFYQCINGGNAANIDESDFRKYQNEINEYLKKKGTDLDVSFTTGVLAGGATVVGLAELYCLLVPTTVWSSTLLGDGVTAASFMYWVSASGGGGWGFGTTAAFASPVGWITAAAAIIGSAVGIGIYIFLGDDEVGGICGTATRSTFEQCANHGTLKCRDDYEGGIVGLGTAVTINNCLNTGTLVHDEDDTYGSMLGKALADDNGKKCKVTNCYSSTPYTIIGGEGISAGVDNASGNNFRVKGSEQTTCDWEMPVPTFDRYLNGQYIGYLLNNSVENRRAGIAPWRYSGNFVNGQYTPYPVLDTSHDEITVDCIPNAVKITTAEELLAFAADVNDGSDSKQFKVGILMNDIEMPAGKKWTPIGKNESGKHFRGVFDGQGHTISGLEVEINSSDQGAGLFGTVHNNAIIRNVIVDNTCKITNLGIGGAAGIVGRFNTNWYWSEALIENCASYAEVFGNICAGGILGRVSTGDNQDTSVNVYVENCYNCGTITAGSGDSGLLCGYTKNHGHIRNCWSAGKLLSKNGAKPYSTDHNEFFVGYESKVDIMNCYALDPSESVQNASSGLSQNGVTNLSQTAVASGEIAYRYNKNIGKAVIQQNIGTDPLPVPGNKGVYHVRTISESAKGFGTVCLPYGLESNDEVSYYEFEEGKDNNGDVLLAFTYKDKVSAGEPVLFRTSKTGELTFRSAGEDWKSTPVNGINMYSDWGIAGTYDQTVFTDATTPSSVRIYYVSGGEIRNAQKTTIAPYRAYLGGPSISDLKAAGTKVIQIVLDDEAGKTTALGLVGEDLVSVQQTAKTYSIIGTEVGESYRGIVIKNGKKMIQKR